MKQTDFRPFPEHGEASNSKDIHNIPKTPVPQQKELSARLEVVEQLKAARKEQDMTQEALAARVGTKKSNISRFESGSYNPSLDFLIKIAKSLGKQLQIKVK